MTTLRNHKNNSFPTEESFESAVNEYIEYHELNNTTMTMNGLAYHLGISLQTLKNFPNGEYKPYIDYAITRIAIQAEERAIRSSMKAMDWLERAQPEVWEKVDKLEVSGDNSPRFEIINRLYNANEDDSE